MTPAAPGTRITTVGISRAFQGVPEQVREVRRLLAGALAGCPAQLKDMAVLVASELAANAVLHSNSGRRDGEYIVRAQVFEKRYLWVEVEDAGGPPWEPASPDGEPWHGLGVVQAIAGAGNWGVEGDRAGWVVWARLDWPRPAASHDPWAADRALNGIGAGSQHALPGLGWP